MSRTYNVNVPVTAYSQVYSMATSPGKSVTVTYTLSAETMLATPPLSGNDSVCQFKLSAGFNSSSDITLLSAIPTGIKLYYPSIFGDQSSHGYITTSTNSNVTNSFTCTIKFNDLNFFNTSISLSGNSTTSVIVTASSTIDNPMYTIDGATTDSDKVNSKFKTVGNHVRGWSLNG